MEILKTAKVKILSHNNIFNDTFFIYKKALTFYIKVVEKEFNNIKNHKSLKDKMMFIERLTHKTNSNNNVKYDFSKYFYKFPSYLRRATIGEAIGIYSSHFSRLKKYNEKKILKLSSGKKFYEKAPTLNYKPSSFPVFYKGNMSETFIKSNIKTKNTNSRIKIYKNNDWVWIDINHKSNSLFSGKNYRFNNFKIQSPSLVKKGKKVFLHFGFSTNVKLKETKSTEMKIISVDLGLTNSAVCCCMDYNGTVLDRLFINQKREKDQIKHTINKLSKAKKISGIENSKPNYWRKINNLQKYITQNSCDKIVNFALKHNADIIVFEHLGKFKSPKNFYGAKKLRAKLQHWAKIKIQNLVINKAHSYGIRYSKVLANGTSMYAFDGSGEVKRNSKKDIATFKNNKQYHCDLSASFNIAARYLIIDILKTSSEMDRSFYEAKVPHFMDRSRHTLSTLISIHEVSNLVRNASKYHILDKEVPPIMALAI